MTTLYKLYITVIK